MSTKKNKIIRCAKRGLTASETLYKVEGVSMGYIYKVRSEYKSESHRHTLHSKKHKILRLHRVGKKAPDIAKKLDCNVKYVYRVIKEIKDNSKHPLPERKYNIIYADPAWHYANYSELGENKSAEQHYTCMSIDDIQRLPVSQLAADNCVLFLWVTFPLLKEGIETIEKWGFEYKTIAFNWIKTNRKSTDTLFWGMGYWTRSNSEICLLATKGKPQRLSRSVHSVLLEPVERHSKKPDIVRSRIVELCGDLPRIELFARCTHDGWDAWGNEV